MTIASVMEHERIWLEGLNWEQFDQTLMLQQLGFA